MKLKMAADQVLKRFSRQIRKEDAYKLRFGVTPQGASALFSHPRFALTFPGISSCLGE